MGGEDLGVAGVCRREDREQRDDQGSNRDNRGIANTDSVVNDPAEKQRLRHAEQRREDHRDQEQDHERSVRARVAENSTH
jgi:hypothetical protein